jgi:uncharacterized protein (DUF1778 family)
MARPSVATLCQQEPFHKRDLEVLPEASMSSALRRKDYPLSMRLPEADIAVIDRAAALRGRSRTDFVREAAVRAAEAALLEDGLIHKSEEGFAAFLAAVSAPIAPPPEMVTILKRPAPWNASLEER